MVYLGTIMMVAKYVLSIKQSDEICMGIKLWKFDAISRSYKYKCME